MYPKLYTFPNLPSYIINRFLSDFTSGIVSQIAYTIRQVDLLEHELDHVIYPIKMFQWFIITLRIKLTFTNIARRPLS